MKTILFINGCIRESRSRTLKIARTYIEKLKKNHDSLIIERDLCDLKSEEICFFTNKSVNPETGELYPANDMLAKEFASVDEIVIAAPFWEFMFPAIVSCYFEMISVVGITFRYTFNGSEGLCKANFLTYIYTSGDYLKDEDKISEIYVRRLSKLYGISEFSAISAQGLDIETNDAAKIVDEVCGNLFVGNK